MSVLLRKHGQIFLKAYTHKIASHPIPAASKSVMISDSGPVVLSDEFCRLLKWRIRWKALHVTSQYSYKQPRSDKAVFTGWAVYVASFTNTTRMRWQRPVGSCIPTYPRNSTHNTKNVPNISKIERGVHVVYFMPKICFKQINDISNVPIFSAWRYPFTQFIVPAYPRALTDPLKVRLKRILARRYVAQMASLRQSNTLLSSLKPRLLRTEINADSSLSLDLLFYLYIKKVRTD